MSLMICTACNNKLENHINQATETRASGSGIQHTKPEISLVEEAWQASEISTKEVNEGYVVSPSIESANPTKPLNSVSTPQQTDTITASMVAPEQQPSLLPEQHTDKVIYLTFDDGPSKNTPKVLDILQQENVKATFFVTGHHERYVHLIKREFDEGHAIGAHSFSHQYSIYASIETFFTDLEKLQLIIKKYTGSRTNLIRLIGGSSNTVYRSYTNNPNFMHQLCKELRRRGYQYIDWNLSSKDSSKSYVPSSTIVTKSCRDFSHDICLLLHDSFGKESTVEALPTIIKYYKEKGYHFGIIDETSSGYHHI